MLGGNHRTDWITTYPFTVIYKEFNGISGHPKREKEIIIGNDVWIGQDAFILPGANIGDGAVIGARALVSKSVEPYSIFVGNPGETIRKRFDEKTIERLLEIKWWDWDIEKIKKM
jgi:acetyltransferase-like isoleucine patch superfamily enzyme